MQWLLQQRWRERGEVGSTVWVLMHIHDVDVMPCRCLRLTISHLLEYGQSHAVLRFRKRTKIVNEIRMQPILILIVGSIANLISDIMQKSFSTKIDPMPSVVAELVVIQSHVDLSTDNALTKEHLTEVAM